MTAFVSAAILLATPAIAVAQGAGSAGGMIDPGLTYSYTYSHEGQGLAERSWVTGIVLWRLPIVGNQHVPLSQSTVQSAYRSAQRRAEDANRRFLGGTSSNVVFAAETDGRFVYVNDVPYALPARDSTLVLLVRVADPLNQSPPSVQSFYTPLEVPPGFWPRHWTSGDTSFSLRPSRGPDALIEELRRHEAVRAFLGN